MSNATDQRPSLDQGKQTLLRVAKSLLVNPLLNAKNVAFVQGIADKITAGKYPTPHEVNGVYTIDKAMGSAAKAAASTKQ